MHNDDPKVSPRELKQAKQNCGRIDDESSDNLHKIAQDCELIALLFSSMLSD